MLAIPTSRIQDLGRMIGITDHLKFLLHIVCAVTSDIFGNEDFAWKGYVVWIAWEGEWAKGK
jgi:hypothetical protein